MARPGSNRRVGLILFAVVPLMVGGELRGDPVLFVVLPGDGLCRHHQRRGDAGRRGGRPAGEGVVRRQYRAGHALAVPAEAEVDHAEARRDRARVLRGLQPDRSGDRRAGRLQRGAVLGGRVFRQDRLLLLQPPGAPAARARRHAGDVLRRPGDAEGPRVRRRDRHHAVLYHVPDRAAGRRRGGGGAGTTLAAAPADRGQTIEQ